MANQISAFLIVSNEEDKIERCLQSLDWVNEIIIVDSGSTDKTLELCKRYTDKILSRKFTNYSDQKNFALEKTSHDWVFSIDADEVVTPELKREIKDQFARPHRFNGYKIPRKSYIFGKAFKYSGTQLDQPIRLFQKSLSHFERPIHEVVVVKGSLGTLNHPLEHFTYRDISEYFNKFNRYTTFDAEYLLTKNKPLHFWDFFIRPVAAFIKQYGFLQGYRDGWEGFVFCVLSSFYIFITHSKYKQMLKAE